MGSSAATSERPWAPLRIAGWGVAINAAVRVVGMLLESRSLAASVAQAIVAEWGTGRLDVRWTAPDDMERTSGPLVARRIAIGAAFGAGAGAMVALFLVSTRAVVLERAPAQISMIATALLAAGLTSVRDELLLRGVVLRALAGTSSAVPKVIACGVIGAAAAIGEPGTALATVAVELILGLGFGALWIHDRGAWLAWGAHTSWLFVNALLLGGGMFEARVAATSWGGGNAGPLGGMAAVLALLPVASVSILWATLATSRAARVR
ncbi:hypothetical protein AKJ09_09880 [Labilithrix luteola]|uniref:CAAX prenyl protease 2/Lysostaphin resistance protein A-like domain-containing protein n=1 Tax=Labilithrix luteola TaxID=1391654 RepID=A0A0K1QC40_9BACT|nr:CPBP family glutamic-type intramembrane protease [Labilithrix luteola]AKV03217.1 hypothetical protein AKJ09_09880 [Labilithrix luteola]